MALRTGLRWLPAALLLNVAAGHAVVVTPNAGNFRFRRLEVPTRWVLALQQSTEHGGTGSAKSAGGGSAKRTEEVAPEGAQEAAGNGAPADPLWAAAERRKRCFYVTYIFLFGLFCAACCCYCCASEAGAALFACIVLVLLGLAAATEANFASGLHRGFVENAKDGKPLPIGNVWCWLPLSLTAFWSAWYLLVLMLLGGVLLMSCVALTIYSCKELARSLPGAPPEAAADRGIGPNPFRLAFRKARKRDEEAAAEGEADAACDGAAPDNGREASAVECPVCLSRYTVVSRRPQVLGCGHTFCSSCVSRLTRDGRLRCPTCREDFHSSEVRVNYALRDAMAENKFPRSAVAEAPTKSSEDGATTAAAAA